MAWMGTPHDGEIVRQRENIGDRLRWGRWVDGDPLLGKLVESLVGANINMTSPGRAMKSCILC